MISKNNTIKNDSLLKSKSAKFSKSAKSSKSIKNKLDKKTKNKNKKNKTKRIIDKYCSFYKTDINGKINKKLFLSCKLNKYCRKYKCKDIDYKMIKLKKKQIGLNYNTIIFNSIKTSCPDNLFSSDDENKNKKKKKACENKAIKKIYKDNNIGDIYKQSIDCDNLICSKEKKNFNNYLFQHKQFQLNKSQKNIIKDYNFENEVDKDLIEKGDL